MFKSRKLSCWSRPVHRTKLVSVLGPAFFVMAALSPASAQDTLTRIKQDGVMHVANSGVYPPFESMEEGKLVGFDIDLSHLVASELGVRANIQVIDFKGLIAAIKSGKTDMCICGFAYTPERAQQVALSTPYYPTAFTIVIRGNTPDVPSKQALSGKRIGVEFGTTGDREARSVPNADVKSYDTLMLAMKDLQNNRVDAVIGNLPPVRYLINRNFKDLRITHTYSEGYIAVAMRLEDQTLVQAINSALDKLKADGRLRELELRWFGEPSN
jgi:ABC-type amino acid transport substrate-binding protein